MNTPAKETSTLAITSLISGILGWTLLPWLGSIVAIITGHMARKEIRNNPATKEGDGMALAGLIMGWAMVALSILSLIVIVLFFGGLLAVLGVTAANGG
ncbi:MAG TPA: DUF4190 domain-containing protein [Arenimonas sp.]|jgi:multidrug efflux pump subunit AcrB|nr:DUF4190 domain-containing protein [Arenimonas sp.]HOZ04991.1 DUF4190 domain-containing protein [Arenimonas sp.]HPO24108.1 DUF4190 domain-containing protein [Arenimonas sp.]HPW33930.1 DUF4190 domain-containing protein [Arenimonas sp.]